MPGQLEGRPRPLCGVARPGLRRNSGCGDVDSAHAGSVHGWRPRIQEKGHVQAGVAEVTPARSNTSIGKVTAQSTLERAVSELRVRILGISPMYCSHMIAEGATDACIHVARSGTPRPAIARLLCGPQPANLQQAEVSRKYPKLLLYIGFSRHARHQKRLDSGHFLCPAAGHNAPRIRPPVPTDVLPRLLPAPYIAHASSAAAAPADQSAPASNG